MINFYIGILKQMMYNNASTLAPGEEAAGCSEDPGAPLPPPLPPRQLRVVEGGEGNGTQPSKTLRVLAKVNLVMSGILFFCQVSDVDLSLLHQKDKSIYFTLEDQHSFLIFIPFFP